MGGTVSLLVASFGILDRQCSNTGPGPDPGPIKPVKELGQSMDGRLMAGYGGGSLRLITSWVIAISVVWPIVPSHSPLQQKEGPCAWLTHFLNLCPGMVKGQVGLL